MVKFFKFRWSVTLLLATMLVLMGRPFVDPWTAQAKEWTQTVGERQGGGDGREGCPHERAGLPRQNHDGPRTFVYYLVTYPGGQFIDGPFATMQEANRARIAYTERVFKTAEVILMGEGR